MIEFLSKTKYDVKITSDFKKDYKKIGSCIKFMGNVT